MRLLVVPRVSVVVVGWSVPRLHGSPSSPLQLSPTARSGSESAANNRSDVPSAEVMCKAAPGPDLLQVAGRRAWARKKVTATRLDWRRRLVTVACTSRTAIGGNGTDWRTPAQEPLRETCSGTPNLAPSLMER